MNKKLCFMLFAAALAVANLSAQTGAHARTFVRLVDSNQLVHPLVTPAGENPATFACIYGLVRDTGNGCTIDGSTAVPSGGSHLIVIVDAYDFSVASSNLATFSTQFGLPAAKFTRMFAAGTRPSSGCTGIGGDGNWGLEESLDIEYAHAMAPNATIVLMEAASDSLTDLFAAVTAANTLIAEHGGKGEVSMSWGTGEFSGETAIDSTFTQPGVTYFASSGDAPGTIYPSVSPNVVAVGGTVIDRNIDGLYVRQTSWIDGGGGLSTFETAPSFQAEISNLVGTERGVPDVALNAGTSTAIYNTGGGTCGAGWEEVEGTSISAPSTAGIVNNAGTFNDSSNAQNTEMYSNLEDKFVFTDITVGSCSTHGATVGWDFCTGLGVPNGFSGK